MKPFKTAGIFVLMFATGACWAYGGSSSSSKACAKPKFSDFVPAENAEIAPGSAFSFTASKNSYPNSIKVSIKDQSSAVKIEPKNDGSFAVTGQLPASLKGTYARIAITADAQSNCNGSGGWLVKISE